MSSITDSCAPDCEAGFPSLLDEPEHAVLLRMTKLVERVFRVPVAWLALLGPGLKIVTRVGSGSEHWKYMQTFPVGEALAKPGFWPDPSGAPAAGFISGDLKFVAWAPLRSCNGLDLGLLAIADVEARPDFPATGLETLTELASVLAGKMELRMMASQSREAELTLREAERRFRSIADAAPVMIIYSGADGAASFVNRTWLDFTGRTFEDEVGDGYTDTFHPDYREPVMQTYWDAFQARRPLTMEFPMWRHDGVYRWMRASGIPRFRGDGSYLGYIGCLVDLTDQRAAISELRKQTQCVAAVAEAVGAFYLILDPEGRIEQVSPLCQRTSGRDPGKMRGRFLWEACDGATPASAVVREAISLAASGRQTIATRTRFPSPVSDGKAELLWRFTPVLSEQNEVLAVAATTFGLCTLAGCACGCP